MVLRTRQLMWGLLWVGAAYGTLCLGMLPGDFGHSLCGPWGCFPPLQALAALHGFWLLLLLPPLVWVLRRWPARRLRRLGSACVLLGVLGLGAVAGHEALYWLPGVHPSLRRFYPQRVLYALAMLKDVPLVQIILAGMVCWVVGMRKKAVDRSRPAVDGPGPLDSSPPRGERAIQA